MKTSHNPDAKRIGYRAYVDGQEEVHGHGSSPIEALGKLLNHHGPAFGVNELEQSSDVICNSARCRECDKHFFT